MITQFTEQENIILKKNKFLFPQFRTSSRPPTSPLIALNLNCSCFLIKYLPISTETRVTVIFKCISWLVEFSIMLTSTDTECHGTSSYTTKIQIYCKIDLE